MKENSFLNFLIKIRRFFRLDNVLHYLNWAICNIYFRFVNLGKTQSIDFSENVLILKDYIDKDLISQIKISLEEEISKSNIFTEHDLGMYRSANQNMNRISIAKDIILKNSQIYYDFPSKYLKEVSMVIDPLKNINKLSETINDYLISVIKTVIKSNVEIVKVWAYRTNNHNGLTKNFNDKFHKDGDFSKSLKCIVYLSDTNIDSGPFGYIDNNKQETYVCEKKGAVILFRSSELQHKGSSTINSSRYCFSFLVQPALRDKLEINETIPEFQRKTIPFLPASRDIIISNNS